MIVFYAENPSTFINGISLSNKELFKIFKTKKKVLWIEEFGQRKLFKEFFSIFKIFKTIVFNKKVKYFYCVLPASTLGLAKIFLILKIISLINKNVKYLFHIHRGDFIKIIKQKFIFRFLLNNIKEKYNSIHLIFAISEKLKVDLNTFFKKKIKIFVKRNVLPFNHSTKPLNTFLSKSKIKLIYLSNITVSKGIIDLCKKISKKKYYELVIFGKILDPISQKFFQNNSFNNIKLKSPLNNTQKKFDILREYDAMILPSRNEGDPLCIIEAMSVGLPVICYNVGYIKETLGNDYDLYLDKNNLSQIYKKLKKTNYRRKISYNLICKFKKRKKINKNISVLIHKALYFNK